MSLLTRILGIDALRQQATRERRRYRNAITAASKQNGGAGYAGVGNNAGSGEDALNQEYLTNLATVLQRAQDLDVNNPDVRGFHRTRTAQILGAGVKFRCHPRHEEVGLTAVALAKITGQIDRVREIHSRLGGFDASGKRRSEGTQQVRSFLTTLVVGSCLIHRVWMPSTTPGLLPFRLELIPGNRISTPYDKAGDPLISYGIQYADSHRSRVTGYWVRRVAQTRGNSFVPDTTWDFVPLADGSLMELTEIAGLDRALPISVANVRMLRNRGEFMEAAVESARAQAGIYASTELAEGDSPFERAADDADETVSTGTPAGFVKLGNGVQMIYCQHGEKINWNSARLPDPDFPGFVDKTDERLARGFCSSLSRFTRRVNNSWAGGRLEDQQDDPLVAQYREVISAGWQRVHEWFIEACWLTGAVAIPHYSLATSPAWTESRVTWPGKVHINPVDTSKARGIDFGLRTQTPQQACEEDGTTLVDNLRQWAQAIQLCRGLEKEFALEEGDLEILLPGALVSNAAGKAVSDDMPTPESGEQTDGKPAKKGNRMAQYLNRMRAAVAS